MVRGAVFIRRQHYLNQNSALEFHARNMERLVERGEHLKKQAMELLEEGKTLPQNEEVQTTNGKLANGVRDIDDRLNELREARRKIDYLLSPLGRLSRILGKSSL